MKLNQPVRTIMTHHVYSVQHDDKLTDAYALMRKHHIRHVPVLYGKQLVGIISRTDLNRLTFSTLFANQEEADEAILEMLTIPQVMSHKPRVVKESDTIKQVAEVLASEEFHALPVVKDNDESVLAGIVTTTDVIRYMLEQTK